MARIMSKAEMEAYDDYEMRAMNCPYRNPDCPKCNPTSLSDRALKLINELAPVTRRDDWWSTDGPREIIEKHLTGGR
jgi:hypothetical protein